MRKHRGELDIDEDIQLESTNWKVQRVAWVVMSIFVLAALLGFTGDGGIGNLQSLKAGDSAEGLEVEYERFIRRSAPAEIKVKLHASTSDSLTDLHLSKDFYEQLKIDKVVPEPAEVYTTVQGITYRFATARQPFSVTFYLTPKGMGSLPLHFSTAEKQVAITQFIHP
ncbi:hypothetical protein [Pontibacter lucknowensis]|uniref:Uncharacterized protein n=1 Tax=Pontibacter lucknowensis TaxID=1077936 RepID=A0A1N6WG30_9BACT|nr:hypothetical protein [Pontibacter lucknowensis]SIQ89089.1 hypothetical protein SAMN05421545_1521 [Pontibacter lucknowensis]